MGDVKVLREAAPTPEAKCMACKKVMKMDITPFQINGIDKPIKSKCPFCGVDLYCAVLILVDTKLDHLYKSIMSVVAVTDKANQHLMG